MTDPASSPSKPNAAIAAQASAERTAKTTAPSRGASAVASVLCGVVAAGIGLLPWWVEGITLPLQNIWATEATPDAMPLALLPFSQYYVTTMAAMLVMGGAVAGAAQRWLLGRWALGRRNLVTAGLAATQVVCVVQAAVVTGGGLEGSSRASVYLAGLVLAALVSVAVSIAVQRGLAGRGSTAVMLASTAGALALGMWISALASATWGIAGTPPSWLYGLATWLPSVIVGVAIGICGVATARRAVGVATSLLALWVLPAFATALSYAVGTRIYLQNPAELMPAGLQVLGLALGPDGGAPQRVLIAVALGVTTWAVRRTVAQRAGH